MHRAVCLDASQKPTPSRAELVDFGIAQKRTLLALAFLVATSWLTQIMSGFFCLGVIAYSVDTEFTELMSVGGDGNFV